MNPSNITHLNRDPSTYGGMARTDRAPYTPGAAPRKFIAKGHDAQLQDAQMNRLPVKLTLMSGGSVKGTIAKRDKFTITVRYAEGDHAGQDEIFYKHAIEGVLIDRSSAAAH